MSATPCQSALVIFLGGCLLAVTSSSVYGRFELIEDYDALALGPVSGQNGWIAGASTLVAVDPEGGDNQVLAVTDLASIVRKSLLLPQDSTRMMFLRFRVADQLSGSFGLSHLNAPTEFSDFGPELNLTNSTPDLRIANGSTPGVYDRLTALAPGTWYNAWLLVDNAENKSQVWLNDIVGVRADPGDQLANSDEVNSFGFRTAGSGNLVNFYIKTGSGSSGDFGPLYIDDIYLETTDAFNLLNPTGVIYEADFDLDGDVDAVDLTHSTLGWLSRFCDDLDGGDFLTWQRQLGSGVGAALSSSEVPERTSTATIIAMLAMLQFHRRRSALKR